MALVIGVALVAALIVRHSATRSDVRTVALVSGLALGTRLAAIAIITLIATQVHPEGVWLSDEASYFLATGALLPSPWDQSLPRGLDHLGGSGYLGLTTAISLAVGANDALAFRMANATFGTIVALLCAWLGYVLFGRNAGLIAGLGAAMWPELVLWSAAMVRDTLCSLAVVGAWWALVASDRRQWLVTTCFVCLTIVLLATLRVYLAIVVGFGVAAWLAYPFLRRQQRRTVAIAASSVIVLTGVVAFGQSRRMDTLEHEMFYRQTVTRMETLGRLYRDPPPPDQTIQPPFLPGAAIALFDSHTGWLLTGLVEDSAEPGFVNVGLTDDTSRRVPISQLVLLQDAHIPALQLFSWLVPSAVSVVAGLPSTDKSPSLTWVGAALAWDGLLVFAVAGLVRSRLQVRDWLFPLCVVGGTIAALVAIPGDPGNAERHRATQTVPLLLVLASGVLWSRARATSAAPGPTISASTTPTSATTAVTSSRRSAR